jgi:hypothetical protein
LLAYPSGSSDKSEMTQLSINWEYCIQVQHTKVISIKQRQMDVLSGRKLS